MRICFFGDSFVNGTGDDDCLGWVGRLCAEARRNGRDVTCYNLGIRRDTSADVAARWEREAAARLPAEHAGGLVFSFGVNDCVLVEGRPRLSIESSLTNARSILDAARALRPTLMVGPPCTGDAALDARVEALSGRLETLCRDVSVPYLPIFWEVADAAAWRREARDGDGVHPNREGYGMVFRVVRLWPAWQRMVGS